MRELRSCTAKEKPMIAVIDPDLAAGHLTVDEISRELVAAEANCREWGFEGDGGPDAAACYKALFTAPTVEWNRIGAFQEAPPPPPWR